MLDDYWAKYNESRLRTRTLKFVGVVMWPYFLAYILHSEDLYQNLDSGPEKFPNILFKIGNPFIKKSLKFNMQIPAFKSIFRKQTPTKQPFN